MADKMIRNAVRSDDGFARAMRGDEKGNSYVRLDDKFTILQQTNTDFSGKESGNLTIPHIAYRGSFELENEGGRLKHPTPYAIGWAEPSTPFYENIYDKDIKAMGTTTTESNKYACQLFSFNILEFLKKYGKAPNTWTIDEARDKIEEFELTWIGYGEYGNSNGCSLHIWSAEHDIYSNVVRSHDSSIKEELILSSNSLGSSKPARYIDDDGFLHFLIRTNQPAGSTSTRIATDYVSLKVVFNKEYIATDISMALDGESKALRVLIDNDKPKAYDVFNDRYKVSVEDSTTRRLLEEYIRFERQPIQVENLFVGELDPDGFVNDLYSLYRGEKETRILISTDQEGFRMIVGAGPFDDVDNFYTGTTYPSVYNYSESHSEQAPLHVLPIFKGVINVEESTWEQAYAHRQLNDFRISFRNTASEKANVTIKIMRIFK